MKKIISTLLIVLSILLIAGCGSTNSLGDHGKLVKDLYEQQEWEVGTLKEVEMNKVIKTDYLDFQVTGAEKVETYDGYEAAFEGYEYYVVDVTVKNTFKEAIPVGTYDFVICYEIDGELVEDYPYSDTGNGEMYPDDITLDSDASVSGKLVFDIPNGAKLVSVSYVEIHLTESGGTRMGTMYIVPLD